MGIFGLVTHKDMELAVLRERLSRFERKSISPTDPTLASIFNWQLPGEAQKVTKPYAQIPIVYACVRARATNVAQVPLDLFQGDAEVSAGPVWALLDNPNPRMSKYQLWEGVVTCMDLKGNAYILQDERLSKGVPLYLWLLNPERVDIAKDRNTGEFVGYWLKHAGRDTEFLEPERMIHFRTFNPWDDLLGLSPLDVARLTYETEWEAIQYNRNFFANDATPGLAFVSEQRLPDVYRQQLQKELIDRRKGTQHAHGAVLLEGGMDVKVVGLSQKDIQFLEQRKFNREEVCMIYKVPKAEVELYEDMNYATALSADRSFWKKTLIPIGVSVTAKLNRAFLGRFDLTAKFDWHAVDALNSELLEKVVAADKLVNMGFPLNAVNRRLQLGFEEVEGGDEPRKPGPIPLSLQQLGKARERKSIEGPVTEPLSVLSSGALGAKWVKIMTPLLPIIGAAGADVRNYFHEVKQRILRVFAKRAHGRWVAKEINWNEIDERAIVDAFSSADLQEALEKHIRKALGLGASSVAGATPYKIDSPEAKRIIQEKLIKVLEVNETGKGQVIEALRGIIAESIEEGVGPQLVAERIFDELSEQMKNLANRAKTIARTEINGSFSRGRWDAMAETEPVGLRWIASQDEKVRDTHDELDGKTCKIDSAFHTLDGDIRYPHDPDAVPALTINCRCTFEAIYEEKELGE
jgi:HK97 family phage portal protein